MLLLPTFSTAPRTDNASLIDRVHHADFFDLCGAVADASVDAVICDLPYGTTACAWDTVIPFEPMWSQFKRVIKPKGAIVLTASQPFTSALVMSNPGMFKYAWVWNKVLPSGFLNSKLMPMKAHEDVCIFGDLMPSYFPQMTGQNEIRVKKRNNKQYGIEDSTYGKRLAVTGEYDSRYPVSIIEFSNANQQDKVHPTQKPVGLFEYLIRTYTQPGELVLDPTCGSGTTAIAARNTGRHFIVGDLEPKYVATTRKRLAEPYNLPMFGDQPSPAIDLPTQTSFIGESA